ncbi:cbb3-type cytochrome oxidase assembly protein CcoS [Thiomonas sp.]|jgi:cbb3-type cytochrome oxidase maturation protein|uniref:cbb3-type cytochrome oxidase assembly protein CcoS n=1 Tax=Thiomonas sp. TaxID=2047785 RepID=UPI0026101FAE|nr:cbb3-type cytochrome oxidase assembly protein CcoS [Thiomonas sp.]
MEGSLLILIPISVLLVLLIVGVLWWAARSGQFDDLEGPAHAILMDDDRPKDDAAKAATGPVQPDAESRH